MGGTLAKLLVGAFFVALSSQLGELAKEIVGRARESVQASELMTIDGQLAAWAVGQRRTRAPRDTAEFEVTLRDVLSARGGRDVSQDRWGQAYVYERLSDKPAWRITSKGPDRALGTSDDLVVERQGDRVERSRDPVAIIEKAIEAQQRQTARTLSDLRELARRLEAGSDDEAAVLDVGLEEQAQAEASLAQLDRLLKG